VGWVRRACRLSDHASDAQALALRLYHRQSDRTMNRLNIILISHLYKHLSLSARWQFCLGSASSLGYETPYPSRCASRCLLDIVTTGDDKLCDYLSNSGTQTLGGYKSNVSFATHVTNHSHWFGGRDNLDYCVGTHSTALHWELMMWQPGLTVVSTHSPWQPATFLVQLNVFLQSCKT